MGLFRRGRGHGKNETLTVSVIPAPAAPTRDKPLDDWRGPSFHQATEAAHEAAVDRDWDPVELDVVGESNYQDAMERIAGPRDDDGKNHSVGITLRCDPKNQYDANAIRVEAFGQLLGYIPRGTAAVLSPAMQRGCGGSIECLGVIVGGWSRDGGRDTGSCGIRVWADRGDLERIAIDPAAVQLR